MTSKFMWSLMENSVGAPQETRDRIIPWFSSLTSGYIDKELKAPWQRARHSGSPVFSSAL